MRWKVSSLLMLVLAAAIVMAIDRLYSDEPCQKAHVVFGAYLACLATATVGACYAKPETRRPWLGFAIFGWSWLALVLRHFLGMVPDVYAPTKIACCLLGAGLGILCALACHALPGMK